MTSSGRPRTANAVPGYRQAHGVSGLRQTKGRRRFAWVAAVCGARAWCPSGSPNKSRGPVAVAVRPNGDPQLLRRSPVASHCAARHRRPRRGQRRGDHRKHRVGAMPAMRRAAAYAARVPSGKPNDPVPVHPHLRPLRRRRGLRTVGRRNLESRVLAATRGRDR